MERSSELQSYRWGFDPADIGFQCFQALEFDPDGFIQSRTLDIFNFAAVRREIVDSRAIVRLPQAPQDDLSIQPNSGALPRPRSSWGVVSAIDGNLQSGKYAAASFSESENFLASVRPGEPMGER